MLHILSIFGMLFRFVCYAWYARFHGYCPLFNYYYFNAKKQCHLPNILQPKQIVLKHPSVTLNNKEFTISKKRYLLRTTEQKGFCSGVSIYTTKIITIPPHPLKKKEKTYPPVTQLFLFSKPKIYTHLPTERIRDFTIPTTSNHKNREGYNHQKRFLLGTAERRGFCGPFSFNITQFTPLEKGDYQIVLKRLPPIPNIAEFTTTELTIQLGITERKELCGRFSLTIWHYYGLGTPLSLFYRNVFVPFLMRSKHKGIHTTGNFT